MSTIPKKRLEITYTGNFAGIDFRDQVELFAAAHGLTGYVSKEAEDRVKMVAEGEETELKAFLHDLNEYMEIFIEHYTQRWDSATGEYIGFRLSKP